MWKYTDIERINPAGRGQKSSVLQHLLRIGATWPELLCETAEELEQLDSPWVCCFAQLPYPIAVEVGNYSVRGQNAKSVVHLNFKRFHVELDESFHISPNEMSDIASYNNAAIATQVRGFIQLWGRRVSYYENYLSSVGDDGVQEQIINPRGSAWDHAAGLYQGEVITSSSFEGQLAERLRPEMYFALKRFLINYSVVAMREIPRLELLFNYFLMPAPGRVAYGEIPRQMLPAMLRRSEANNKEVSRVDIERALQFGLRELDKYLHQLLAMQRLANDGERELAMIGCGAAIEWYMNSLLPDRTDDRQLSLGKCLKKEPFKDLPGGLKQDLIDIANSRNGLVHGQPPDRAHKVPREPLNVEHALRKGLELYREMNLRRSRNSE